MTKRYRSKTSYGLLAFVFLVFFGPVVADLFQDGFGDARLGVLAFLVPIFALVVHVFFGTVYTIRGGKLHIQCGFISYRPIDIAKIKSISASRSLLAAPAPSFDRLEIRFGRFGRMLISPKDKAGLTQSLASINPDILIQI